MQHFEGSTGRNPGRNHRCRVALAAPEVTEAAMFGERSRFVELGLPGELTVAEAIRVAADHHHVTWADETIFAAIELAAGYPRKGAADRRCGVGDDMPHFGMQRSLLVTGGWPRRTSKTA